MNKVYQTIIDPNRGNCMAACWATLLKLELWQVPNFAEYDEMDPHLYSFIEKFGYKFSGYLINPNRNDLDDATKSKFEYFGTKLPDYGHVNGYYDAVIFSPRYFDSKKYEKNPMEEQPGHSIIIDKYFNIVHDPHPKSKEIITKYPLSDTIEYSGILGVSLYDKVS